MKLSVILQSKRNWIVAGALFALCYISASHAQKSQAPEDPERARLWADLKEVDRAKSRHAVAELTRTPKPTVAFIATKMAPVIDAHRREVETLIKNLDSDVFAVRDRATRELEKLGEQAVPGLRAAQKDNPPAEVHVRIEQLLKRLAGPITQGDKLRAIRAVEVLERLGTDEAKSLLRNYASGAAGARVTEEAQDALARLDWVEPKWKSTGPVISAESAARVAKMDEVAHDVWEMGWWPRTREPVFLSWESPIEILDSKTFKAVRTIGADKKFVHFAVSTDANSLAWCENDTRVIVQNLRSGRSMVLEAGSHQPSMAISGDGRVVATGGYGTTAKVWDAAAGFLVHTLDAGPAGGLTPVFSPDEKILAIGNRNGETRLYETETGKLLHVLPKKMTQGLKFSPDGRVLAAAYVDGSIGLWDVANGQLIRACPTSGEETYRVEWSPRGDVLVTSGRKSKTTLWDPKDLSVLKELESPEWVICVRFSPDGARLFSAGGSMAKGPDRKVTVWGVREGLDP